MNIIKQKSFDRNKVLLIIFTIIFIALFKLCSGYEKFYSSDISSENSTVPLQELTGDILYKQQTMVFIDKTNKIGVQFATYGDRNNTGNIEIYVYHNYEKIGYKVLDVADIADGSYQFVELEKELYSGDSIDIEIKGNSKSGQAVTLWASKNDLLSSLNSQLKINDEPQATQLNIAFEYKSPKITNAFVVCSLIIFILFVATGVPQYYYNLIRKNNKAKRVLFYISLIFIGTVIVCLRNMEFIDKLVRYGEDGYFLNRQLRYGFINTLFETRSGQTSDFPNTGVYIIIWLATKITMFLNGLDLSDYPFWAGIFANMYIAFTATVAYRALELLLNKKAGFIGYFIVLFVNMGNSSSEVFGRPLNTAFLWTTTVGFLLVIQFIRDDGFTCESVFISLLCFIGSYTFAIAFLEIAIYLLFILLKTIKDNQWKRRIYGNFILVLTLILGLMQLSGLLSSQGLGATFEYNPDGAVEFFLARHILFPFISSAYNLMNDTIVVLLMVIYMMIIITAGVIAKRNKFLFYEYMLFAGIALGTCFSSAFMRRTLTAIMHQYSTSYPDRYFFSCNILSMTLLFIAIYILIDKNRKIIKDILCALTISILLFNPYLFYFVEENYSYIHSNQYNGDLADACKIAILNIGKQNPDAIVDIYPPEWKVIFPLQYTVITGINA